MHVVAATGWAGHATLASCFTSAPFNLPTRITVLPKHRVHDSTSGPPIERTVNVDARCPHWEQRGRTAVRRAG